MQIPMSSPDITQREVDALAAVLRTGRLSLGSALDDFERLFAAYAGAPFAVGVASGTAALHLAVLAAGVTDDDLVITTPFSFVASANCLLYERAIPIFVDVDPLTGNVDRHLVEEAAHAIVLQKSGWRRWLPPLARDRPVGPLKALLPVHAFGQPADMDPLVDIARQHQLSVIEDACEAIGSEYKGRRVGTLGDAATFAFYPNKQMTTGEGGMITTTDRDWYSLFRSLRNQGRDVFDEWLNHSRLGYNYRLDEMSAALGVVQVGRLDELLARRRRVAEWYDERLRSLEHITVPHVALTTTRMCWFVYVVRIASFISRDAVMKALAHVGIPSRPYFGPIHLLSFYGDRFGYRQGDFPTAERLGRESLALPFSSVMNEEQVDYVCAQLKEVLKHLEAVRA